MYKAYLSYAQLKEYLSVLIENNLIEYLEETQTYKTTEKGLNLKCIMQLENYYIPESKMMNQFNTFQYTKDIMLFLY